MNLTKRKNYRNWIIIGGTGRNVGKTTLAEKLIKKFSQTIAVTAVKISNIRPENENFHGHDVHLFNSKIRMEKETRINGNKDTMRFLTAGAQTSWFIQTKDEFLDETFPEMEKILGSASWIICESNSLIDYVRPGIFIMVKGDETTTAPKEVSGLLQKADVVINALNEIEFNRITKQIEKDKSGFFLPGEKRQPE